MEGDLLNLGVGRAGAVEQELEELGPHVVAVVVRQVARNLGGQVCAFPPAVLVRLVLDADQNLVF